MLRQRILQSIIRPLSLFVFHFQGEAQPASGFLLALIHALSFKCGFGERQAGKGSFVILDDRFPNFHSGFLILPGSVSVKVGIGEAVLSKRVAFLGSLDESLNGLLGIFFNSFAGNITPAQAAHGSGITIEGTHFIVFHSLLVVLFHSGSRPVIGPEIEL